MADPLYNYIPLFGVEPFIEIPGTNGGARVTAQELIITLWQVEAKGDVNSPIVFSDIVIPRYVKDSVPENEQPYYLQGMHGRVSSRIFLDNNGDGDFGPFLCAVLNPPQELKQQLANSVIFNGGDPLDLASYTFLKSQQGCFTWRSVVGDTSRFSQNNYLEDFANFQVGSLIPGSLFAAPDNAFVPLLSTNGADGVAPVPFDMTTEQGAQEAIQAVNRGNFYVPFIFTDDGDAVYRDIYWPYSASRG